MLRLKNDPLLSPDLNPPTRPHVNGNVPQPQVPEFPADTSVRPIEEDLPSGSAPLKLLEAANNDTFEVQQEVITYNEYLDNSITNRTLEGYPDVAISTDGTFFVTSTSYGENNRADVGSRRIYSTEPTEEGELSYSEYSYTSEEAHRNEEGVIDAYTRDAIGFNSINYNDDGSVTTVQINDLSNIDTLADDEIIRDNVYDSESFYETHGQYIRGDNSYDGSTIADNYYQYTTNEDGSLITRVETYDYRVADDCNVDCESAEGDGFANLVIIQETNHDLSRYDLDGNGTAESEQNYNRFDIDGDGIEDVHTQMPAQTTIIHEDIDNDGYMDYTTIIEEIPISFTNNEGETEYGTALVASTYGVDDSEGEPTYTRVQNYYSDGYSSQLPIGSDVTIYNIDPMPQGDDLE